jgi:hypothetical protein
VEDAGGGASSMLLAGVEDFRHYPGLDDPLAAHQPAVIDCGVAGAYVERDLLEVDTAYCNYVLLQAPARDAIAKGTRVSFAFSHFDLTSAASAEGHVAILFGADVQWEAHVDIPHVAQVLDVSFSATRALGEGEPIRLHLHNHGQNSWAIGSLTAH